MKKGYNVLSVFDGCATGKYVLEKLGVPIENYFASEIDPYAMIVAANNHLDIRHIGDVTKVSGHLLPKIDLLIGGSPCQGFSFAGKQLNFEDPRSKLFFEFVRLKKECKPKFFFLENVRMKKEYEAVITEFLGLEPVSLDSNLVSAQNRKRLYWTNIPGFEMPEDKGILLRDILDYSVNDFYDYPILNVNMLKAECATLDYKSYESTRRVYNPQFKCPTLTTSEGGHRQAKVLIGGRARRLTPLEYERAQTLPDNYTIGVSNSQRYKMLGNGWTAAAVAEFFKHLPPVEDLDLY